MSAVSQARAKRRLPVPRNFEMPLICRDCSIDMTGKDTDVTDAMTPAPFRLGSTKRTLSAPFRWGCIAVAAGVLAGCAASTSSVITSSVAEPPVQIAAADEVVDCKDITGSMQVRILEARTSGSAPPPSTLSRALQSSVGSLFGTASKTPSSASASQPLRADLDRDNRKLAAAGCRSFDLDAELAQTDFRVTPSPTVAPPKAAAKTTTR